MQTQILIGLFICHWLADYTHLSTAWMLHAKQFGKPLFPIFIHASVNALLMALVLALFIGFGKTWAYLVIFQWWTHFLIDLWKGRMNGWFPSLQSPQHKWHWIIFGFDQLLHSLVIIGMSFYAVSEPFR
ncbi:MAG: DUF3307 domain-containing protein [Bacteroidota bacterium]|jgi:hypothetical protein